MKNTILLFLMSLLLVACNEQVKPQKDLPSDSIFNLTTQWQNQNGDTLLLKELRGKTLVVVMIYTTCKSACPILVADMKNIASKIDPKKLDEVSLVLVSIDSKHDTPEVLKDFAKTRDMVAPYWVFLRSDVEATQSFANVLSMKYKEISPMEFSHSNIISIFSPDGALVAQEQGLNIDAEKVAKKVNETVDENR